MITLKDWKKLHRFQKRPGWCGPAVIQMALLASGIKGVSQPQIAKAVYKDWWGTDMQIMIAYLSRFFSKVNYKHDGKIADIAEHLEKGHIVMLDWWDDLDLESPNGHYSIAGGYDLKTKMLTLIDPSNARQGIWEISAKDFQKKWYDSIDVSDKMWIDGWMLWIDPTSKIEPQK